MNCEEFELIGLDLNQSGAREEELAAAKEHLRNCAKCAVLVESWEEARAELFLLADRTREAETPARVEMRLRQEFRARRRPKIFQRRPAAAAAAAWALAAAAVLIIGVSWWAWKNSQGIRIANHPVVAQPAPEDTQANEVLLADNDGGAFTLLPGSIVQETENASVMQVRMQRGALGALGLPVDQERVSDWIQVDLLVGEDGIPEAVRLHQDAGQGTLQ
jgi:anti-sigma-K factor RskA